MNDNQLQEIIDLQRFKIHTLEQDHEKDLEELKDIFNEIFKELGIEESIIGMWPQNMRAMLHIVKERNTPDTRGWYSAHGVGRNES